MVELELEFEWRSLARVDHCSSYDQLLELLLLLLVVVVVVVSLLLLSLLSLLLSLLLKVDHCHFPGSLRRLELSAHAIDDRERERVLCNQVQREVLEAATTSVLLSLLLRSRAQRERHRRPAASGPDSVHPRPRGGPQA